MAGPVRLEINLSQAGMQVSQFYSQQHRSAGLMEASRCLYDLLVKNTHLTNVASSDWARALEEKNHQQQPLTLQSDLKSVPR